MLQIYAGSVAEFFHLDTNQSSTICETMRTDMEHILHYHVGPL